jgi:hypothetical protein
MPTSSPRSACVCDVTRYEPGLVLLVPARPGVTKPKITHPRGFHPGWDALVLQAPANPGLAGTTIAVFNPNPETGELAAGPWVATIGDPSPATASLRAALLVAPSSGADVAAGTVDLGYCALAPVPRLALSRFLDPKMKDSATCHAALAAEDPRWGELIDAEVVLASRGKRREGDGSGASPASSADAGPSAAIQDQLAEPSTAPGEPMPTWPFAVAGVVVVVGLVAVVLWVRRG